MKPEHEALVKYMRSFAADACQQGADAIVSLSAELARYREAPVVEEQFRTANHPVWMSRTFFRPANPDTCEFRELIVRPTEAK